MTLFGEITIPSSRILWDDDEDSEPNIQQSSLEWHGNTSVPPEISTLLIVETSKLLQIAKTCLQENSTALCSMKEAKINIYKLLENNYLILCDDAKDVCAGEITEKLMPWIDNAKRIIALTSASLSTFYCGRRDEMDLCVIRALANGISEKFAPKLEAPNLITGICAGVLSYCKHIEKSGTIYICYLESRPLDSTSAKPILQLLQMCNIPTNQPFAFKPRFQSDSNLYM